MSSITKRIGDKVVWIREFKAGDIVASVATPIARALNLPCIDPDTKQLKPESRCNKWRKKLNHETNMPKYQITLQYQIEAETPIEAQQKALKNEVQPNSIQTREIISRAIPVHQAPPPVQG